MTISLAFFPPISSKPLLRVGSLMEWELLAWPICRLNGLVSTRCSAFLRSKAAFEPGLRSRRSPFPGNGIFRPETNRRNGRSMSDEPSLTGPGVAGAPPIRALSTKS